MVFTDVSSIYIYVCTALYDLTNIVSSSDVYIVSVLEEMSDLTLIIIALLLGVSNHWRSTKKKRITGVR